MVQQIDGSAFRILRKINHYLLDDVVEGTGLSKSYLSEIERGVHPVTPTVEAKLLEFYGLSKSHFTKEMVQHGKATEEAADVAGLQTRV